MTRRKKQPRRESPRASNFSPQRKNRRSCLAGGLDGLADAIPALLLEEEDGEALEVGERAPCGDLLALLVPARRLPLARDLLLLNVLLHDAGTRGPGELLDSQGGEGQVAVGECLAGDTSRRAVDDRLKDLEQDSANMIQIDTHPVVVDDLRNDGDLTSRRAGLEEDHCNLS